MRVHDTLMTILILAGIVAATTPARKQFPSIHRLFYKILTSTNTTNASPSEIFIMIGNDVETFMRKECAKNGGPSAYSALNEASDRFESCIEFLPDPERNTDWTVVGLTYAPNHCTKGAAAMQCVSNITDYIKPCLAPEEHATVEATRNMISSFLEFICQDNGTLMTSFVNSVRQKQRQESLDFKPDDLLACARDTYRNYTQLGDGQQSRSLDLGPEECTLIEEFRNCTVGVMRQYRHPAPSTLADSIFDFYKNGTCRESFLLPQATPTTSGLINL